MGIIGGVRIYNLRILDRRDFLLFRSAKGPRLSRHYVLSCEWLYKRCLDQRVTQPAEVRRAIFDEEAIRLVFDDLDTRFRDMETVRVTRMEWLVGDIRKEFGNLMRAFRSRGGRVIIDGVGPQE
jgi:hypothetical protein